MKITSTTCLLPPLLLLPLKCIYPKHQLVDMQYCPSMATMASTDPNLIPSVAQFHLRLLHECYYCYMCIMPPAQNNLLPLHETLLRPHECNHCCELEGVTIA